MSTARLLDLSSSIFDSYHIPVVHIPSAPLIALSGFVSTFLFTMARTKLTPKKHIAKSRSVSRKVLKPPRASMTKLETYTSPLGVVGEFFRLGPPKSEEHTNVIFLPGNPGLVSFYRGVLSRALARCPSDVRSGIAIHGLALPGHDARRLNDDKTFVVADHIAYVRSYIAEHISSSKRLVVCGHSYGAFLGLRVLKVLPEKMVKSASVFLLMPCVRAMSECCTGVQRAIIRDPFGLVSRLASLLGRSVPYSLIARMQWSDFATQALGDLLSNADSALYSNVTALARDEMREIKVPPAVRELDPERVRVLWVDGDQWCTRETVKAITQRYYGCFVEKLPGVQHAFSLDHLQGESVAKTLASWLISATL